MFPMDRKTFGSRIRQAREEHDPPLTQTLLGLQMSESQKTISKWETGRTRVPIEKLPKLAMALGTSVDYLLSLDAEPSAC